ncbi:F-box protein SKIP23-like [Nicotiana sylvestris]|uniref:F-box protein SKIP23-like n=1 Tax=Nicotiana sylvestris TaxID=4096 RepID=UPI00388C33F8
MREEVPAVPWLMLAEKEGNEESREFFDMSKDVTRIMSFPELVEKRCLGVGFPGWIFMADEQRKMNLFHLFSRSVINLPDMDMLEGFDYEWERGFCRYYVEKADRSPLLLVETPRRAYSDITWYDGQFCGVDFMGNIIIFDFRGPEEYPTVATVVKGIPPSLTSGTQLYMVHSLRELLVITRDGAFLDDDGSYGVEEFHVYKIDVNRESYEEVVDLGNRALFLGSSATLAVEKASQIEGCKGNCIYFTDDCWQSYFNIERGGGKDMGIYNLLDGIIEPHYTGESYHKFSPPLWIFK